MWGICMAGEGNERKIVKEIVGDSVPVHGGNSGERVYSTCQFCKSTLSTTFSLFAGCHNLYIRKHLSEENMFARSVLYSPYTLHSIINLQAQISRNFCTTIELYTITQLSSQYCISWRPTWSHGLGSGKVRGLG